MWGMWSVTKTWNQVWTTGRAACQVFLITQVPKTRTLAMKMTAQRFPSLIFVTFTWEDIRDLFRTKDNHLLSIICCWFFQILTRDDQASMLSPKRSVLGCMQRQSRKTGTAENGKTTGPTDFRVYTKFVKFSVKYGSLEKLRSDSCRLRYSCQIMQCHCYLWHCLIRLFRSERLFRQRPRPP